MLMLLKLKEKERMEKKILIFSSFLLLGDCDAGGQGRIWVIFWGRFWKEISFLICYSYIKNSRDGFHLMSFAFPKYRYPRIFGTRYRIYGRLMKKKLLCWKVFVQVFAYWDQKRQIFKIFAFFLRSIDVKYDTFEN